MSKSRSPNLQQDIAISDHASITESQVGGQAGRDLTVAQNQGSGNVFQGVTFNLFGNQDLQRSAGGTAGLTRKAYRNRQALLNKVKHHWVDGVLNHSLSNQLLLNLRLEERPEALVSLWNEGADVLCRERHLLPEGTTATDVFDQMGEGGRTLLILGSAGAGKTTLLLALARDLIARAEFDIAHPIPVVFNLSSWVPARLPIDRWLVKELSRKYQVPKQVGQSWIDDQQLLLLLDGLDEVQSHSREACVVALNTFNQDYGPELVICSRMQQYDALSARFNVQTAICLRSLTEKQIHQSIAIASPDLDGLSTLVQRDQTFRELAKSPLMLNLMITAYCDIKPAELLQRHRGKDRRQQLFDAYTERVFRRRQIHTKYTQAQTLHWLSWLAQRMSRFSQTVFLIEDIQPACLQNKAQRTIYWIVLKSLFMGLWGSLHLGLLAGQTGSGYVITFNAQANGLAAGAGLLGGLVYGLVGGPMATRVTASTKPLFGRSVNALLLGGIFGPIFGWVYGQWMYGVAYGCIYAVIGVLIYGPLHSQEIEPVESLQWFWRKALVSSTAGFAIGGVLYLGTSNALLPSLIFGLVLSLTLGFDKKEEVDPTTLPNQGIWKSAANSSKLFLTLGGLTGVLLGASATFSDMANLSFIGVNALLFGMASALLGGQGSGIACLKHFVLRTLLWQQGCIPWNYARFLDYAAERILLQKVGGSYVFIHRALLEYFATLKVTPGKRA